MSNQKIAEYLKLAFSLEKQKKYQLALEQYREALKVDKNNFQAWFNTGMIYSKIQKSEKAIICYTQALKQKKDEKIYYNLGVECFKLQRFTDSMEAIKQCLEQNSGFLFAYLLLAVIADQLHQFEVASNSIKNLLQLEPKHRGAHTAMIILCIKNEKYDIASNYLERLTLLGERKQVINQLKSKLSLGKGDISESIQLYQIMWKENPELKNIAKSLKEILTPKNEEKMKKEKNWISNKTDKEKKDWFDLSLISLFEGDGEKAMIYLEKSID